MHGFAIATLISVVTIALCYTRTTTREAPVQVRIAMHHVFESVRASPCARSHMEPFLNTPLPAHGDGWFEWDGDLLNRALNHASHRCAGTPRDAFPDGIALFGNRNLAVMELRDTTRWNNPVVQRSVLWRNASYEDPYSESIDKVIDWWRRYLSREGCTTEQDACDRGFHVHFLSRMRETLEVLAVVQGTDGSSPSFPLYAQSYPSGLLEEIYSESVARYATDAETIRFPERFIMVVRADRVEVIRSGVLSEVL
jgi:hypothetical protein